MNINELTARDAALLCAGMGYVQEEVTGGELPDAVAETYHVIFVRGVLQTAGEKPERDFYKSVTDLVQWLNNVANAAPGASPDEA